MDSASMQSFYANVVRKLYLRRTLIFFIPLLLLCISIPAQALEQNTAFLPIKINSLERRDTLVEMVDSALRDALSKKHFVMLERFQAESLADYGGPWPPPIKTLQEIAKNTGFDHVAAGSLTVFGDQLSLDFKLFNPLSPSAPTFYTHQGKTLDSLQNIVNQIISDITAFTGRAYILASIAPSGNKRIDSGAILRKVRSTPGDLYSPTSLKEDLKAIYKMGYFDDVQIDVEDSPKGKKVTFVIVEKPVISSISFSGTDEIKEKEVQEVVTIKEQSILNPGKINSAKENIKALYRSKGYYNTKVTQKLTFPTPENVAIQFVIDEGEKIYIKTIQFEGNTAFDDDDLEDVIATQTKGWLSWITEDGLLDRDKVNQDAGRIVTHYHNHGYLDAKVGEPVIKQEEKWLYVTFSVEEGSQYRVGTIDVSGDLIAEKQAFIDLLAIRNEEFMSRKIIREDVLRITDYYAENGFAFASIRPNFQKSTSGKRLDVIFQVNKGDLVYINRITIRGNSRTRDNVIRRDLQVAEGGVFDSKGLRTSTQKLQRLDFFEDVTVSPEPTLDPSKIDIVVNVKEKSTGQFSVGAGYSSVDDVVIMGEISENNFLGRGDQLSLSANIGGSSTRFNLAYTDPRFNDSQLSWGIDLFNMEREYDDYTKDSKGGAIRIGYPIWEKWRLFGDYSYTDTELSDVADDASYIIQESQDINITSALRFSFKRDTRNKNFNASAGSQNVFSVKYAGGPLGGDSQFTKIEGSTSWFFPLIFDSVFHFKAAAGQVFENEDASLPVYERFFLGGLRTIRGYEYGDVSPKDPETGESIGGDKMWYTNIEVIFPIVASQGLHGVVFFDAGDVLAEDTDWNVDDYAKAVGLGIRWISPIGPLRLAWGYNLDPEEDEDQSVWDFSVGGYF